jgi:hypothetical protein
MATTNQRCDSAVPPCKRKISVVLLRDSPSPASRHLTLEPGENALDESFRVLEKGMQKRRVQLCSSWCRYSLDICRVLDHIIEIENSTLLNPSAASLKADGSVGSYR